MSAEVRRRWGEEETVVEMVIRRRLFIFLVCVCVCVCVLCVCLCVCVCVCLGVCVTNLAPAYYVRATK